jgi:hypothetical protein
LSYLPARLLRLAGLYDNSVPIAIIDCSKIPAQFLRRRSRCYSTHPSPPFSQLLLKVMHTVLHILSTSFGVPSKYTITTSTVLPGLEAHLIACASKLPISGRKTK